MESVLRDAHGLVLPRVVTVSIFRGRVRRLRASGDQGIMPTPKRFSVRNISRSSSRYTSEWWFCIEIKGVRLFAIA